MHQETRGREVKEGALKKGITVVEWAIFSDKLNILCSYATPESGLDMKELRPRIQNSLRYRNQTTHQRQSTKRCTAEEEAAYVKRTHPLVAAEPLSALPFVSENRFHSLRKTKATGGE